MDSVPDWLTRRAWLSPEKVALVDTIADDTITYERWNARVNQTAHFLCGEAGVQKGDLVAILARNCVAYLDVWFAMNKTGGVLQNLNWRLTAHELADILQQTPPKVLVYDPAFADRLPPLRRALPNICWISLEQALEPGDLTLAARENHPTVAPERPPLQAEDPWLICYTGGTTGLPKGAVLSYRAVTANAVNTIISWGLSPDDVTILNAPLFHTGGLNVFTAPLVYLGGTSIVCRGFDVDQTLDLLESGRVTVWFGVPTMFVMMQNHPRWDTADFSRCRFLISGGAPCPLPVFERFWEKGVEFKTGYGLTEAGPNTFWLPPEQVRTKPGAVGYPLFHIELQIVDENDRPLPPGEIGELLIRGPHLFSGYINNPEATAQALRGGWLHTGDLAMVDEDGCYSIMGRIKDMIISGGENIYPAEVESVLHAHPAVAEAALVGVPDEKWGEVGWAAVVPRPDREVSVDELLAFCRERLAGYKIPKRIIFCQALPKTGANKVDKKRLREMLMG
ncbi:MAG: long-chain fatty acid--CoA ligase [Caldilineae bacterium]|nr:MAG: long-chain fatty acid--CoA ligase [Caldilineae bacterium]